MEKAVDLGYEEVLEALASINMSVEENEKEEKIENLPALVKASLKGDYELVKILVTNGYLLR